MDKRDIVVADPFSALLAAARSFLCDPPDSGFQQGYLCAIVDLARQLDYQHADLTDAYSLAYPQSKPTVRPRPNLFVV